MPQPAYRFLLLSSLLWVGCAAPKADAGAGNAFLGRLDSISRLDGDSVISAALGALYHSSSPAVRNEHYRAFDHKAARLLVYNPDGAPGIVSLFHHLCADPSLEAVHRATAALELGTHFAYTRGNPDSADHYLALATRAQGALTDSLNARRHGIEAQAQLLRGARNEAIGSLYHAIRMSERLRDTAGLFGTHINLADVYRGMGNPQKAIDVLQRGSAYITDRTNPIHKAFFYGSLGSDFLTLKRYDSAYRLFKITEALLARGPAFPNASFQLYCGQGKLFTALNRHDSALYYFERAAGIQAQTGDPEGAKILALYSAPAYARLRDVGAEAALIRELITEYSQKGDLQKTALAFQSLLEVARVRGNFREALSWHQGLDSVQGLIADKEGREFTVLAEKQFEAGKKDQQINIQQGELERRRSTIWVLALAALAALLAGGVFVSRIQLRHSRRTAHLQHQFAGQLLTATEEERGRIAAELHDGVNHELLTLKNSLETPSPATEGRIDAIINSIRFISRNLHPVMLREIGLARSIEHLCEQTMNREPLFVSAEMDYAGELAPSAELQVYRIVQEALTNTIKYAGAHAAKVQMGRSPEGLVLTIRDNGKGFNVEETLHGGSAFGLFSILERAHALGGKATITSSPEGTLIHLDIPLRHGHRTYSR
ncbi:tetratricopeptide repeat-containing sensor histidine kinase [Flaviaesturariibacter amylovorans]|uniref:Histidine kinase domain-containing protein n=1 Tax=Flaviaesturariibacter amylovorans TaxID=1084520 RepID=A0ABP8GET7_9BACT